MEASEPGCCLPFIKHPLQPFSKQYFDGSNLRLHNYKPHWFSAAGIVAGNETAPFYDQPLNSALSQQAACSDVAASNNSNINRSNTTDVDLDRFINFFKDPAQQFLTQGLQIQLLRDEAPLEDDEPFALDGLQKWELKQQISGNLLTGAEQADILATLYAQGVLPMGPGGEQLFFDVKSSVAQYLERLAHRQTELLPAQEIHLSCGQFTLTGQLEGLQSIDQAGTGQPAVVESAVVESAVVEPVVSIDSARNIELPATNLVLYRLGTCLLYTSPSPRDS